MPYNSGRPDYHAYIQSPQWRQKANEAKRRAGYRCQVCNKSSSEITLDAHHRTYERLGDELPEDITVLCRNCHQLYEFNKNGTSQQSMQTEFQEDTDSSNNVTQDDAVSSFVKEDSTEKAAKYFLSRLGTVIAYSAAIGNGIWIILIEWNMLLGNWALLIDPTFQLQTFFTWITSVFFWQLTLAKFFGVGLSILGRGLYKALHPNMGMFRWFWQWKGTAIIKVPLFLTIFIQAILWGGMGVVMSTLYIASRELSIFEFPIILPLTRFCLMLVSLAAVHLTWDNKYKDGWLKLITSFALLLLFFIVGLYIETWWAKTTCNYSLTSPADCAGIMRLMGILPGVKQ